MTLPKVPEVLCRGGDGGAAEGLAAKTRWREKHVACPREAKPTPCVAVQDPKEQRKKF